VAASFAGVDLLDEEIRCSRVRGVASEVVPYAGFRFVCYCQDCQAFARFLDRLDGPYTSASRPNQFLFCSTLADNRRTIILVIEPLSQSDRASSNSCFSD